MSTITVQGHSGCPIRVVHAREVVCANGRTLPGAVPAVAPRDVIVEKNADGPSYAPRLLLQAAKQHFFSHMFSADAPERSPATNEPNPLAFARFAHVNPELRDLWAKKVAAAVPEADVAMKEVDADADDALEGIVVPPILWVQYDPHAPELPNLPHPAASPLEVVSPALPPTRSEASTTPGTSAHRVVMPFAHHTDCPRFLGAAALQRVTRFERRLAAIVTKFVAESQLRPFPASVTHAKLLDVRRAMTSNAVLLNTPFAPLGAAALVASPALGTELRCAASVAALNALGVPDLITATLAKLTDPASPMSLGAAGDAVVGLLLEVLGRVAVPGAAADAVTDIPIGYCHGDLTLSNVLVQEHLDDRLVLIDFLDSFIESPLADLAKLRQDLVHGWTLQMLRKRDESVDGVRLYVLQQRLYERVVVTPFAAAPWYAFGFYLFSIVNQLRVLQYGKEARIAAYLMDTIMKDMQEWCAFLTDPRLE